MLDETGGKFIVIPCSAVFDIILYNQDIFAPGSLKCATTTIWTSSASKSNAFKDLKPHGGAEILLFDDSFVSQKFAVMLKSIDPPSCLRITANQHGTVISKTHELILTDDPIASVLEKTQTLQ